jgi:uncharacterized membrane protein
MVSIRETAAVHVLFGIVIGGSAAVVAGLLGPVALAPLIGWDVAGLVYLAWTWRRLGRLDGHATAAHAVRDDPTRAGADLLLLVASAASLVAVAFVIVRAEHAIGLARDLQTGLGTASVVVSWLVVHTTYTLRYATLYHGDANGGIDFNADITPRYTDFAYLAFTIGMTFQVSDTSLTTSTMRANALRHGLLSYLYGTVIIATAINMVAGFR